MLLWELWLLSRTEGDIAIIPATCRMYNSGLQPCRGQGGAFERDVEEKYMPSGEEVEMMMAMAMAMAMALAMKMKMEMEKRDVSTE